MNRTSRRIRLPGIELSPARAALAAAGVTGAALALALAGQAGVDRRPASAWAWAALVAGAAAFGLLARSEALERPRAEPAAHSLCSGQAPGAPRRLPLALGVALAALSFPGFAGNLFRPLPTLMWLASLALVYAAFATSNGRRQTPPRSRLTFDASRFTFYASRFTVTLSWHVLALLAILLVAAFLRLYRLDAVPAEMGTDMPLLYENAREIMQGQLMIFCPRYPGREALFHYLIAGYGAVFGLSYFAIKFTSAMVGLASILAVYGLARHLFDRQVGLIAAGLLALSRWHVTLSRSGYRAALMPLMVAGVMYLLSRALRRGRGGDWVLAGMSVGLGLYTYNGFMVVPLVVGAALALELLRVGKGWLRRQGWGLAGCALGALAVFVPMGRYVLEAPESYLFRAATRVTSVETPLPANPLWVLAGNMARAAGMFNLRGDIVSYINVPGLRELGLVSGALFLCGLAYALFSLRRGQNAMVLVFLVGLLLPTALAIAFPNEVPSAQRAAGAIVPAYLLAGAALAALLRQVRRVLAALSGVGAHSTGKRFGSILRAGPAAGLAAAAIAAALLGVELAETSRAYFRDYARNLPRRNYAISLEMARTLDDFADEGMGYVKVWPYWYDGNAVRAQLRAVPERRQWVLYGLDPAQPPLTLAAGKVLVIVHPDDREALLALRAAFPNGVAVGHRDNAGQVAFIAFYGER